MYTYIYVHFHPSVLSQLRIIILWWWWLLLCLLLLLLYIYLAHICWWYWWLWLSHFGNNYWLRPFFCSVRWLLPLRRHSPVFQFKQTLTHSHAETNPNTCNRFQSLFVYCARENDMIHTCVPHNRMLASCVRLLVCGVDMYMYIDEKRRQHEQIRTEFIYSDYHYHHYYCIYSLIILFLSYYMYIYYYTVSHTWLLLLLPHVPICARFIWNKKVSVYIYI